MISLWIFVPISILSFESFLSTLYFQWIKEYMTYHLFLYLHWNIQSTYLISTQWIWRRLRQWKDIIHINATFYINLEYERQLWIEFWIAIQNLYFCFLGKRLENQIITSSWTKTLIEMITKILLHFQKGNFQQLMISIQKNGNYTKSLILYTTDRDMQFLVYNSIQDFINLLLSQTSENFLYNGEWSTGIL